jgi:LCP family protein required for cell wall assembly
VLALGFLAVLTVGGVVGTNVVIDAELAGIDRVDLRTADLDAEAEAGNYLVIGSDSRAFVADEADADHFGDEEEAGGQRSDTTMVLHVDPEQERAMVVSIPRDLVVSVPGRGATNFNAAFNDGPQKVVDTLAQDFGLDIHHYAKVDFASFRGIVDAIGSVNVYFPYPSRDDQTGLDVPAGCVALDGDGALAYVRSRKLEHEVDGDWERADGWSDLDRIERQQDFVRRLGTVAFRKATRNPVTAKRVADAILPRLELDDGFGRGQIFGLVELFRSVDPSDPSRVETITFPNRPHPDGARLLPDEPDASELVARLNEFGEDELPDVDPGDVDVRVLNASGVDGLAAATLATLEARFGFAPVEAGNWPDVRDSTLVRFRPGARDAAVVLRSKLGGPARLVEDRGIDGATLELVVGTGFTPIPAAAGGDAPASGDAPAEPGAAPAPESPEAACRP